MWQKAWETEKERQDQVEGIREQERHRQCENEREVRTVRGDRKGGKQSMERENQARRKIEA